VSYHLDRRLSGLAVGLDAIAKRKSLYACRESSMPRILNNHFTTYTTSHLLLGLPIGLFLSTGWNYWAYFLRLSSYRLWHCITLYTNSDASHEYAVSIYKVKETYIWSRLSYMENDPNMAFAYHADHTFIYNYWTCKKTFEISKAYCNKKFWEELIVCFLSLRTDLSIWYDTNRIENTESKGTSIVACVFVAVGTCLPSRFLATMEGDI
jgi:hypothetical protein